MPARSRVCSFVIIAETWLRTVFSDKTSRRGDFVVAQPCRDQLKHFALPIGKFGNTFVAYTRRAPVKNSTIRRATAAPYTASPAATALIAPRMSGDRASLWWTASGLPG